MVSPSGLTARPAKFVLITNMTIHHHADAKIFTGFTLAKFRCFLVTEVPSGVAFDARRQYWNNTAYPEPEY